MIFWITVIISVISNVWSMTCLFMQTYYERLLLKLKPKLVKIYGKNIKKADITAEQEHQATIILNKMEECQAKSEMWCNRDTTVNKMISKISFYATIILIIVIIICHFNYFYLDSMLEKQNYLENFTCSTNNPAIIEFNDKILAWNQYVLWLNKLNNNIWTDIFVPNNIVEHMHTIKYLTGGS